MRVVHFINDMNPSGGAQNLVTRLVDHHQRFAPEILTLGTARGELFDRVISNGLKVWRFGDLVRDFKVRRRFGVPHVLHSHLFPSFYFGAFLPAQFKVVTEHSPTNTRRSIYLCWPIERYIYSRYDKIVCISQGVSDELSSWLGRGVKIDVIENGIELDRFVSPDSGVAGSSFGGNAEVFRVCMVGRLDKAAKDHVTLIKSLVYLPEKVELWLAGDGVGGKEHARLVSELGLASRVRFLGHRSDLPAILSRMDLYVQSSFYEGFGLAAVEAMACGLPVLASDVPGLRETIGCDDALFDPGNALALSSLVGRVITDLNFRTRLTNWSLSRAREFGIERCVSRYEEIYLSNGLS